MLINSVITPDPFISIDELEHQKILLKTWYFGKMTKYNIDKLKPNILNGYDNLPGV